MLRSLEYLHVTERNLLSYRRSLLIPAKDWTASRIPLYYLDPAVPNEKLSKIHLDKLFPDNTELEADLLATFKVCKSKQRRWFSLDDSSIGCDRIHESEHEKKSELPLLVMKLWNKAFVNDFTRKGLLTVYVRDKDHLEFMLKVANTTRFDFWGMRHGENDNIESVIFIYLLKERCDWISLLIDYGFKLENILPKQIAGMLNYDRFMRIFKKDDNKPELHYPSNGPLLNKHIMCFLACFCELNENSIRIHFAGYINMFQKLFRSLLLPTVPHAIVRKCLQQQREYPRDIEAQIEQYYECGVIHPIRCEEEVQPMLSHLCRRVVRERLARNFQLPAGIDALNLPTLIKRFLRLEL